MQPEWVVKKVTPYEDYTLIVEFFDGSRRRIDMAPIIEGSTIFNPLKNKSLFMRAKEQYGTVVWTDEIDVAPEYLYENGTVLK